MIYSFVQKNWKYIAAIVLIVILVYVLRKSLKNTIQKIRENQVDNSDDSYTQENVQFATRIYAALEANWWEDEKALIATAAQIATKKRYHDINMIYKTKYGHTIDSEMARTISTEDQESFYSQLK